VRLDKMKSFRGVVFELKDAVLSLRAALAQDDCSAINNLLYFHLAPGQSTEDAHLEIGHHCGCHHDRHVERWGEGCQSGCIDLQRWR
jgi:hypothetical protein